MKIVILLLALTTLTVLNAQTYEGCEGTPNYRTLLQGGFTVERQVMNGKLFTAPYDGRKAYVLVLNGTAYEMGYAYGNLLKEELPPMIDAFFGWAKYFIKNNVTQIAKLPKFMKNVIADVGIEVAKLLLDLNWYVTKPYTNQRFDDEIQGIADGSGVSVWTLRQVNLLPELLKASCSILGAYGKSSSTGKTIHLRALDWEEHSPISKWPLVTVYHPVEAGSVPFANIGWIAMIGTITGYNSMKVGIGERLGGAPNNQTTRLGTPWNYVLRDALQFSKTQQQAVQWLKDAKRTCAIYLGVGGENYFEILEYAAAYLRVYNWSSWHHNEQHPMIEDLLWKAYRDGSNCFRNILQKYYGQITPEIIYQQIAPMGQTGDSQVAVMDYSNDDLYIMYPDPVTYDPGYIMSPLKIELNKFFSQSILEKEFKVGDLLY